MKDFFKNLLLGTIAFVTGMLVVLTLCFLFLILDEYINMMTLIVIIIFLVGSFFIGKMITEN